jgi:hypothetical protein
VRDWESRTLKARGAWSALSGFLRRLSSLHLHRGGLPGDLKNVGDIRQLEGRLIEVHGQVKEYDGRAEIILEEYRQLSGSTARIPPLPKNYDVEKKGRYSAGTFSHPKPRKNLRGRNNPLNFRSIFRKTQTDRICMGLYGFLCGTDTLVRRL